MGQNAQNVKLTYLKWVGKPVNFADLKFFQKKGGQSQALFRLIRSVLQCRKTLVSGSTTTFWQNGVKKAKI